MNSYVLPLIEEFIKSGDLEIAQAQSKYMRNQFAFYGIKTDMRRRIEKEFFKKYGLPDNAELKNIVTELWSSEYRDLHYFAMTLLSKMNDEQDMYFVDFLEELMLKNSWWDTIDYIAPHLVREFFEKYPGCILTYSLRWIHSDNIWLQRAALIFQLYRKEETMFELLKILIRTRVNSKEFFVQKAIGWSLRQYAKTNPTKVLKFVNKTTKLSQLAKKEALKHLNK